jgi:hypothetical protein
MERTSAILNGFKNRLIYSIPKTISGGDGPELAYSALKLIIRAQFRHAKSQRQNRLHRKWSYSRVTCRGKSPPRIRQLEACGPWISDRWR